MKRISTKANAKRRITRRNTTASASDRMLML
jgi:hypothetical protein